MGGSCPAGAFRPCAPAPRTTDALRIGRGLGRWQARIQLQELLTTRRGPFGPSWLRVCDGQGSYLGRFRHVGSLRFAISPREQSMHTSLRTERPNKEGRVRASAWIKKQLAVAGRSQDGPRPRGAHWAHALGECTQGTLMGRALRDQSPASTRSPSSTDLDKIQSNQRGLLWRNSLAGCDYLRL